ncbi:MAG: CocE/NonD family hydrolase [Cyanobacteria bacterium J06623_5]
MLSIQAKQTLSMQTRDGVRLDADVYTPGSNGPFPVLLMRQPYGREIASTIVYAHPLWYAKQGYIVVIQDVRGRGTSEGQFDLFAHEVSDGEDTVQWAAQLPGSDGQVAMYGFSYQGMTQLQAAQAQPPALKTIAPAMTGYQLYEDWATENGAFCFQLGLAWAIQLAAETARRAGDNVTFSQLMKASRDLPVLAPEPAAPDVLEGVASFFHDWVSRPSDDPYWQQLTPQLDRVELPMLHIGGWFDPYLRGDLRLYREKISCAQTLHHFWVGPWRHIPWGNKVGAVDFGAAAISPIDQVQVRWFDAILKGKEKTDLMAESPIKLFEMGKNQWYQLTCWPDIASPNARVATYFLQSAGTSHIRTDSGRLSRAKASQQIADVMVHDPWNPAPALGGHSAIPAGSFDRTEIDQRGDVLTYTTEPLTQRLRVAGIAELTCAIAASTPSYDLCAILSRVKAGKAFNLTQGYRRVDAAEMTEQVVLLPLHPTCFSLEPGESLRLSLSAACFPAYPVNPGTGTPLREIQQVQARIITLRFAIGGASGAALRLPQPPDVARD